MKIEAEKTYKLERSRKPVVGKTSAGKVLAVLQTRIEGVSRRYEVAGILAGAPSAF